MTITIDKAEYENMKRQIEELQLRAYSTSIYKNDAYAKLQVAMDERVKELNNGIKARATRRQIVDDVKWAFHYRWINLITEAQLPPLLEYIKNWQETNWVEKMNLERQRLETVQKNE